MGSSSSEGEILVNSHDTGDSFSNNWYPANGIGQDLDDNEFKLELAPLFYNPPRNLSTVPCTVLNATQAQISMLDVLC